MFARLPSDNRCQIVQYLYLCEAVHVLQSCKLYRQTMPLKLCFKPDRLSAIPFPLLFLLTKRNLLPQTELSMEHSGCFQDRFGIIDFGQFNLKHLTSITSQHWDWLDTWRFYDVATCCLIRCLTIRKVTFHGNRWPVNRSVSEEQIEKARFMFPNSSAWKTIFPPEMPPDTVRVERLLLNTPINLKQFICKGGNMEEDEQQASLHIATVLFQNNAHLTRLVLPQFDFSDDILRESLHDTRLLYLENALYIWKRKQSADQFESSSKK